MKRGRGRKQVRYLPLMDIFIPQVDPSNLSSPTMIASATPQNSLPLLPLLLLFSATFSRASRADISPLTRTRFFFYLLGFLHKGTSSPWLQCEGVRSLDPVVREGCCLRSRLSHRLIDTQSSISRPRSADRSERSADSS